MRTPKYDRLNLGCGPVVAEGWENVDMDSEWGQLPGVVQADVLAGLPYPDESFRLVVANHVLQMVAWADLTAWLGEVRRVTRPEGTLRLLVPDLLAAIRPLDDGRSRVPIADDIEPTPDGKVCVYITQAGATRSVFTRPYLTSVVARAGWTVLGSTEAYWEKIPSNEPDGHDLDSRFEESIILEAMR